MNYTKTFQYVVVTIIIVLSFCLPTESIADKKFPFCKKKNSLDTVVNPLCVFSKDWKDVKYQVCNTAKNSKFCSLSEKDIIHILNMVRMNPVLFLNTVILNPSSSYFKIPSDRNQYDQTLIATLKKLPPNFKMLIPNEDAYISAKCHAVSSGKSGYVGHSRINTACNEDFYGECCSYGYSDALSIVMSLLLDYDVSSLGHREICLSTSYSSIGVSIQPHQVYRFNAVLDFK